VKHHGLARTPIDPRQIAGYTWSEPSGPDLGHPAAE
jgi:hypothetical protein